MKVTLINHSDTKGGASVVTYRLMRALVDAGVDARMLVVHKATDDSRVHEAASPRRVKASFLAECGGIFAANGLSRRHLFEASAGLAGLPLDRHPLVRDADAVVLGWVNQGMLSLGGIGRIAAAVPTLWTMHDQWCLTGICHHTGDCERYRGRCGHCPLVCGGRLSTDLSTVVQRRKKGLYRHDNIRFVAVSSWLKERCMASSLMSDCRVEVVPNAFPAGDFATVPSMSRADIGVLEAGPIIAMGAARLDDPVKGLPYAVKALNLLADNDKTPAGTTAVFFGALRDPHALDGLRLPYVHLGTVSDPDRLRALYAHASAVLSSSLFETLPGTLIEGQACGAWPVTFGNGGQADIVDHTVNGYIARYLDPADLAHGLLDAVSRHTDRDALHHEVAARFDASVVARRYVDMINDEIGRRRYIGK